MDGNGRLHVASENLIRYYRKAGISEIFFIIRKGKWDIPEYYGDGSGQDVNIGYLIMNCDFGVPFTLSQAYPFIRDKTVAMGFPDIVFHPEDAFSSLIDHLSTSDDDVVLAISPHNDPTRVDMVEFDANGRISDFIIKHDTTDLKYSWFIALWKPVFTRFLRDFTDDHIRSDMDRIRDRDGHMREIYIGDVIIAGIRAGIKTGHVIFEEGRYEDIGTPETLKSYLDNNFPDKDK